MNSILKIGIPSKGRIRPETLKIFRLKKLTLISERGDRELIGSIKEYPDIKILKQNGYFIAMQNCRYSVPSLHSI